MTCDVFPASVLLVEDEPLLAETMRRYLSRFAENVCVAQSCAQAEKEWTATPPGVVLMDYRLPDGLGTEVVDAQRKKGFTEPVICMTGETELIDADLRKTLKIDSVLTKPVMLNALRDSILEAAGRPAVSGGTETGSGKTRRIGKFRLARLRGRFSESNLSRLCKAVRNETWLALDLSGIREVDSDVWPGLCALAGWFSSNGGRLCFLAASAEQCERIKRFVGDYADVFTDQQRLRMEGNRLTGMAERKVILSTLLNSEKGEASHG